MSDNDTQFGEHEARIRALELSRVEQREDNRRIFSKLEEIAQAVAVASSKPTCPDPGACVRLERSASDLNRRLMMLELSEQKRNGVIVACSSFGVIVGAVITWAISLFHK